MTSIHLHLNIVCSTSRDNESDRAHFSDRIENHSMEGFLINNWLTADKFSALLEAFQGLEMKNTTVFACGLASFPSLLRRMNTANQKKNEHTQSEQHNVNHTRSHGNQQQTPKRSGERPEEETLKNKQQQDIPTHM